MNTVVQTAPKPTMRPNHPVPRKYHEPILFLADRMGQHDRIPQPVGQRVVDELAERIGAADFRRQPWFRQMDERKAVSLLDLETSKRAALVVLSLVLKLDTSRGEAAKKYFTRVREMMGAEPIAVPADVAEHKVIATSYLAG